MTTILIDPGLFEISPDMNDDDQQEHVELLANTILFASKYIDSALDEYNGAPYMYYYDSSPMWRDAPITESKYVRDRYSMLRKEIQRMLRKGTVVVFTENTQVDCPLYFEKDTVTEAAFKGYLNEKLFCEKTEHPGLLMLSSKNSNCSPKISISSGCKTVAITAVHNPAIDCSEIVAGFLVQSPDQHDMFPQSNSCSSLNAAFLSEVSPKRMSEAEKKTYFKKYGNEVASRNGYEKKPDLSRKNPRYSVFVHPHQEYYLSIDLEHGGLEVFRYQGSDPPHLGEYDFSCQFKKGAQPETHKITV